MEISDKFLIESIVADIRAKGWPSACAKVESTFGPAGWEVVDVTYKTSPMWNADITHYARGTGNIADVLSRFPSPKEWKTKKLLESVAAAQAAAEELGLPADFVNPLIAMADQLRFNILEAPKPDFAAILDDDIPF